MTTQSNESCYKADFGKRVNSSVVGGNATRITLTLLMNRNVMFSTNCYNIVA